MRRTVRSFGFPLLILSAIGVAGPSAAIDLSPSANAVAASAPVVATVNGEAITQPDLDAEIVAARVPEGADANVVRRQLLQHIVDRKLLLGTIGDKTSTTSPGASATDKRAAETARAEAYAKQLIATAPMPTEVQIDAYIAAHPNAFGERRHFKLDQIRLRPDPAVMSKLAMIQADHTLDAVAAHLDGLGIKYDRGTAELDTAQLPTDLVKAIDGLPAGEPFVLPQVAIITVNAITGREAVPIDPALSRAGAIAGWRRQQLVAQIAGRLKAARASAQITYADGFAPQ